MLDYHKGKIFLESGGYKVKLEQERIKRETEDEILKYQKLNAKFQSKYGNKILIANIFIAVTNIIITVFIATYISGKPKPMQNNIKLNVNLDSNFTKHSQFIYNDTSTN